MSRSRVNTTADILRSAKVRWEIWNAVNRARRVRRSHPARVRICWDLDNTLVDSGSMLFAGRQLAEAVVDAQPVPNMLELFRTLRAGLPGAAHFVLSARPRSMRRATLTWLRCHGVTAPRAVVCFVPTPDAKPQVWAQLGRDALLVIVDDLTHDHESGRPIVYAELVESARRIAHVYVGLDDITWIKTDPGAVAAVAERTAVSLTQQELSQSGHG